MPLDTQPQESVADAGTVEEDTTYFYHDNMPWVQGAVPAFGPGGYSLKTRERDDGEIRLRVVYLGVQDMSNNDFPCDMVDGESITMTWDDDTAMELTLRRDAATVFDGTACKLPVNATLHSGLGNMEVAFP